MAKQKKNQTQKKIVKFWLWGFMANKQKKFNLRCGRIFIRKEEQEKTFPVTGSKEQALVRSP